MFALLGGVAILLGLLLLVYLFVNADPGRLARGLKWTALGAAALAFFGFLASREVIFLPLAFALGIFGSDRLRALVMQQVRSRANTARGRSEVATPYLRMSLDHGTGTMTGTVLSGRFEGMRLAELTQADLLALLRECRAADEEGARLLEAYLDRLHPDWRDEMGGGSAPPSRGGDDMTAQEAYEILGLEPGAEEAAIKAAHHRLMMQLHPDHGGTDYLATQINRARDVLLKH